MLHFLLTALLSTQAFALEAGFPNTLGKKDFFLEKGSAPLARFLEEPVLDCRANIAKVVCVVDPVQEGTSPNQRLCIGDASAYAQMFEDLYDQYPPALQKMFCSLRHIYIERQFFGTAYAGSVVDENFKPVGGALMGIRKSVLDERLNLTTWASWKEQLSFGGITDSYIASPNLPTVQTSSATNTNDFLYFVVAHEFGHIFDFANKLNYSENCQNPWEENCKMASDSWGALSWETTNQPHAENEFPHRRDLCFYACNGNTINPADTNEVYAGMARTNFLSTYAAVQPWDDFADSLGYYVIEKRGGTYALNTGAGATYDIMEKLRSDLFRTKREYIERFLDRKDIVYP